MTVDRRFEVSVGNQPGNKGPKSDLLRKRDAVSVLPGSTEGQLPDPLKVAAEAARQDLEFRLRRQP